MKKSVGKKNKSSSKNFKESLAFKLILIFLGILILLVLVDLIFFAGKTGGVIKQFKIYVPGEADGSLGSMGIFGVDIESYTIGPFTVYDSGLKINISLSTSEDFGNIQKIVVVFDRDTLADCYYNITEDFPLPNIQKNYTILVEQTSCGTNLNGIIGLDANAEILNINLTQINTIPDFYLKQREYKTNAIDLDYYFDNLGEDSLFNYTYQISANDVSLINGDNFFVTHNISLNASENIGTYKMNLTLNYPGLASVTSNNFNVNILVDNCTDSDGNINYTMKGTAVNLSSNGTDNCYNITMLHEYYCNNTSVQSYVIPCSLNQYCSEGACMINTSQNRSPEFIYSNCDITKFTWYNNVNLSMNISNCFSDPDKDTIYYSISNSNSKISIILSGGIITLIPAYGYNGTGYFYIYANDTLNQISATINYKVDSAPPVIVPQNTTPVVPDIKIIYPIPNSTIINDFSNRNFTFAIGNNVNSLDSIRWYLDGALINNNSNIIILYDLDSGNYTLEVQIRKGTKIDSKIWMLNIGEEKPDKKFVFDSGKVMVYLIFIIVIMVIIMIIWLFVQESRKKNKEEKIDFNLLENKGKSQSEKENKGVNKDPNKNLSNNFNIPR
jgi:hypothetical protein